MEGKPVKVRHSPAYCNPVIIGKVRTPASILFITSAEKEGRLQFMEIPLFCKRGDFLYVWIKRKA